jgi:hypothetical protein
MKMSIVKAQKKIHRLKGEISELTERINDSISVNINNEFKESYEDLIMELVSKKEMLISLKNAVMVKNIEHGMFTKILELGENKDWLSFYKAINIKDGEVLAGRWDEKGTAVYKTQLTESNRQSHIKELKITIEEATDELDEFNASHFIEI